MKILLILLTIGFAAHAKALEIQCKTQLARAGQGNLEILPRGTRYSRIKINDKGQGHISYTFSLNSTTDLVYKLDLTFQIENSRWNQAQDNRQSFIVNTQLWDVQRNKLVASSTNTSDHVKNYYLLNKLTRKGLAMVAIDIPSIETRQILLKDKFTKELAIQGHWKNALVEALKRGLVDPKAADFISIHCKYQN